MNVWKILDIEETKDKNLIKDAYRKKLVTVNPEEDQKGFMELRQAYEQAVELADRIEEIKQKGTEWPHTPIGRWMAKADSLYKDIKLRGNVEKWKELLEDDICFSLETKTEARDELLKYFMEHYYLPHKIWKLLDHKFLLREYKEELYEKFPVNYVNQGVIANIENEEFISIQYLESMGGSDYDEFLYQCYELNRLISGGNLEEAKEKFARLKDMKIYHPYVDVFRVRYLLQKEELQEADELSEVLVEKLPEDVEVLRVAADVYCAKKEFEKAKENYKKVLEMCPGYYSVIITMGNICFQLKEYEEAKKYFDDAYDIHKSDYVAEGILNCIAEIEKIYDKKWKENPENPENAIELARAYYQQSKFENSMNILMSIHPDEKNRLEYVHLLGCNYMYMEEFDKALPYLKQWIEGTKKLEDDGTESRKKAIRRLSAAYHCMAQALAGLKRYEEADAYLEQALETKIQVIDTYEERARIYFVQKRYEDVISTCDVIFQYDSNSTVGHGLRAEALYELDYYLDAKEEWECCIRIAPNNLSFYIKKVECLFYSQEFDQALEVLQYLKEQGIENNMVTMWKAIIEAEKGDGNKDKALKILLDLTNKEETFVSDYEKEILTRLYFEIARIYMNKDRDMKKAEFYVDKALEKNPLFVRALNYKGHICWKNKRNEEAVTYFLKVLEEKPNHFSANGVIGEIYEEQKEFETAIIYYTKQLKIEPSAYMYLSRGWSYASLNRFEEARADYEKSIELDPDNPILYFHMAEAYACDEKEELSIDFYKTAIQRLEKETLPRAYRNMAIAYQRMNQYERAVEAANEWWNRLKQPGAIERLAKIYMDMGKYQEAFYQYGRYGEFSKEFEREVVHNRIDCLLLMGKFREASKMIQKQRMSCINQQAYEIQINRINLLLFRNKLHQAKRQFKKLEQYYVQEDIGFGEDLILIYFKLELWSSKGNDIKINTRKLKRIVRKLQSDVDTATTDLESENISICRLAGLEMGKGNYEKAMIYAQEALTHRKCLHCNHCQCTDALFLKAMLLELRGELAEAYTYYEKAAKLDKRDVQTRLEYERVKKKLESSRR